MFRRLREKILFDKRCDELLKRLTVNTISEDEWDSSAFNSYNSEKEFLVFSKYVKKASCGYNISPKGIAHIKDGGFSGERRRRNAVIAFAAFSAVLAGISIAVQFILK